MAKQPSKSAQAAKKSAPRTQQSRRPRREDPDFILHSLQDAFEKKKRYAASEAEMLEFYRQMLLIRRFEEKAGQLYGLGLIGGFCHLYIGQEAVAIGAAIGARQ